MTQHTKGPWRWSDNTVYNGHYNKPAWALISDDGYGILCCDGLDNSPQGLGKSGESNARLIAAAPDLLAACEEAYNGITSEEALMRLHKAILKAKGEA